VKREGMWREGGCFFDKGQRNKPIIFTPTIAQ
jgi:hypothetical protein